MIALPSSMLRSGIHDVMLSPTSSIALLVVAGLLMFLAVLTLQSILDQKVLPGVPELKGCPLLGAAHYYLRDGLPGFLARLIDVGDNGISFARIGPNILVSVYDPELVKDVHTFPDEIASREGGPGCMTKSPFWILRRLIGKNLFNHVGPETSYHRNAFIREFNNTKSNYEKYDTIVRMAKEHAEALAAGGARSAHVEDIRNATDNFAIGLWGETLYGNPENHRDGKVFSLAERIIALTGDPWTSVWYALALALKVVVPGEPTSSEYKVRAEVDNVVSKNIAKLEEYERDNPDAPLKTIRSLSVATGGGRHGPLSTFAMEFTSLNLFGGHHSIGLSVTWALIELKKHPECLVKLMAEIDVSDLNDFTTVNSKMPYLDAVVMEVNRLHPTVHATLRVMKQEKKLAKVGVVLKPNMLVHLPYLHLHTSTKFWGPTAGEFDPERFIGGHDKGKPFMAFGYGRRSCVGYKFAILAIKVYLMTLLKMYKVDVRDLEHDVRMGSILETTKPVACRVTRR